MVQRARSLGIDTMVGNMIGTSLAMAPAFLVGQLCQVVDLDGPAFLESDRQPPFTMKMVSSPARRNSGATLNRNWAIP
jgi:hypothetical protein